MTGDVKWIEVYVDFGLNGEYLLTLRELASGKLELLDPQKGGEVIWRFDNYEDAMHWLTEEEYDLVGRVGGEVDEADAPGAAAPTNAPQR